MQNDTAPIADKFSLDDVIHGLASDLVALREGKISSRDAKVRADMAKQIFNGVRLVVSRALVDAVMRESGGEAQGLLEGMTEAGRRQLRGRENDIEVWVAA